MQAVDFGPLRAHVTGGTDGQGGGRGPVVVLCHGFGAPGTDLVPLGDALSVPPEVRFVFPEAPLDLGAEFFGGRAWWLIDMMKLQMALASGALRDLSHEVPNGLEEATEQLDGFLDEIEKRLGVSGDQLVLGGFSQGAMVSTNLLLRRRRRVAGLVVLSGTLLAEHEWTPAMPSRRRLPVFMSHGRFDPILPFLLAEELRTRFTEAGLEVDWCPFGGQHEIPMSVLAGLGRFLTARFASPRAGSTL